jgi:hypothetical protein
MKQYEILYSDKHTEVVNHETMEDLVYELESFERQDVSQIHELNDDGSLGETIWTEEEGLFISYGKLSVLDDEDYDEDELIDELIDRFYEGISTMSWDEWCDDELCDKESIVKSILESGEFDDIDEDKIYEIFWDWVEGLNEDDFYDEYLDRFNSI